jgi:hypothetical protein
MTQHLAECFVDLSRFGFTSQPLANLALIMLKVVSTFERIPLRAILKQIVLLNFKYGFFDCHPHRKMGLRYGLR